MAGTRGRRAAGIPGRRSPPVPTPRVTQPRRGHGPRSSGSGEPRTWHRAAGSRTLRPRVGAAVTPAWAPPRRAPPALTDGCGGPGPARSSGDSSWRGTAGQR